MTGMTRRFALLAPLALAACAGNTSKSEGPRHGPPPGTEADIAALAAGLKAMSPTIDPEEADRAARVSYEWTHVLALQYEIVDPPIIHNMKVNMGLKPRGLCREWAEDMEKRLRQENFQTMDLHRAIGNFSRGIRIEHSTVILSAKGASMFDGMVIDPWREGGVLSWVRTRDDMERYRWMPQQEVLSIKRERRIAEEARF